MVNGKIEKPVDAEEITKESRANPDNLDVEANVHPETPVAVAREDKGNHRTSAYTNTMERDLEDFDKCDNKTWRKIYEAIDAIYFK